MRTLTYTLSNGTVVYNLEQAKNAGMPFKITLEKRVYEPFTMSPKRAEMLKRFGYVAKALKGKL